MINVNSPCYCCENRSVDCHSNCEAYHRWKKFNNACRRRQQKAEQEERWRHKQ